MKTRPIFKIKEVEYVVDVNKDWLELTGNRNVVIPFDQAKDTGQQYVIKYDPVLKSLPSQWEFEKFLGKNSLLERFILNELSNQDILQLTEDFEKKRKIVEIIIPPLKELHPEGMMEKYKVSKSELSSKTDFEIIVDQQLYDLRVNKGKLPELEIGEHPFYVDFRMFMFRPKDDFLHAIGFEELSPHTINKTYGELSRVPYEPAKHSLYKIDLDCITSIPKGIIIVELPSPFSLDPVGAAREKKRDIKSYLRRHPLMENQVARVIPWNQTVVPGHIRRNKLLLGEPKRKTKGKRM